MTRYLLYFMTGFAHALVILFYRGYLDVPTPNDYFLADVIQGVLDHPSWYFSLLIVNGIFSG